MMGQEVKKLTVKKNTKNEEIRNLDDKIKTLDNEMGKKDDLLNFCHDCKEFLEQMAENANLKIKEETQP